MVLTFPSIGPIKFFNPLDFYDSDNSWIYSINYAVSEGLVFGRDIIFSYGPLSAFVLPLDLAQHVEIAAVFQLSIQIIWLSSIFFLKRHFSRKIDFILFLGVSILCAIPIGDNVRITERTGIFILTVVNFLLLAQLTRRWIWTAFAGAVAAVAVLLKFNVGVACFSLLVAWMVIVFYESRTDRTAPLLLFFCGSFGAFLLVFFALFIEFAGPIDAVSDFLKLSMRVASGYSSSMSLDSQPSSLKTIIFVSAVSYGLLAIYFGFKKKQFFPFILWTSPAIFLLYKAMVVRQGFVVNFVPNFLVIGAILSLLVVFSERTGERRAIRVFATSFMILGCAFLSSSLPESDLLKNQVGKFSALKSVVLNTQLEVPRGENDFVAMSIDGSGRQFKLKQGAPVDVYPKLTAMAWTFNFKYRPRFSLQSYAAYHPELDQLSARGYNSTNAPGFIVFGHESIDGTHPQAVDPLTWLAVYRWYDPFGMSSEVLRGGSILLRRRASPRIPLEASHVSKITVKSGTSIALPEMPGLLTVVSADFRLNWWGYLVNFIYKVERPLMRVSYSDGNEAVYRLSASAAASGFLAGSLSQNLYQVARMFIDGPSQQVQELTFIGNSFFSNDIKISLKAFPVSQSTGVPPPETTIAN